MQLRHCLKESRDPNADPGEETMSWQDAPGRERTGAGAASASWGETYIRGVTDVLVKGAPSSPLPYRWLSQQSC